MFFILPLAFLTCVLSVVFSFTSFSVLELLPSCRGCRPGPSNGGNSSQSQLLGSSSWDRGTGSIHFNFLQYLTLLTAASLKPPSALAPLNHISSASLPAPVVFPPPFPCAASLLSIPGMYILQVFLFQSSPLLSLYILPREFYPPLYHLAWIDPTDVSLALKVGPSSEL